MTLVDANVFLEIVLDQDRRSDCQAFLSRLAPGEACISSFTLHSVCLRLMREKRYNVLLDWLEDVVRNCRVLSIAAEEHAILIEQHRQHGLDYDDSYQYFLAYRDGLTLATMDKDFVRVQHVLNIHFI